MPEHRQKVKSMNEKLAGIILAPLPMIQASRLRNTKGIFTPSTYFIGIRETQVWMGVECEVECAIEFPRAVQDL